MKNTPKTPLQSRLKFLQSGLDCCNLQSGCRQRSLIHNDFFVDCRLQGVDCSEPLQSEINSIKSTTYDDFKIATGPVTKVTVGVNTPAVLLAGGFRLPKLVIPATRARCILVGGAR